MIDPEWTSGDGAVELYLGDALEVLDALPALSIDALIVDPPYSSGGFTRSDRMLPAVEKYCQNDNAIGRPAFSGDNRDVRSWEFWCALWMGKAIQKAREGAYILCFTDWRMLPTCTDAIQAGGWLWRGIVPWDKGRGARAPHKGYFRHQCEYVVWGSAGPLPSATHGGPWDGCMRETVRRSDKHHITGKPTDLMCKLVDVVPDGQTVCDPFMGSGTTGVAAVQSGRRFIGVEQSEAYFAKSVERIEKALGRGGLFENQEQGGLFDGEGRTRGV